MLDPNVCNMCGIAGVFGYRDGARASEAELRSIRDHMASRGPDGSREWFSEDHRVGLGHRRLAIIDLSERALQPMSSADGLDVVVFNGEIYNFSALRSQLEAKGHVFRTSSDTEVLLQLYRDKGEAMLTELSGMFAFAIWDSRRNALFLARDPYGIKPLYYADDGTTFRFASQVKALLSSNAISTSRDPAGQVGFYLWGSVPEPHTLYEAIRALPAGTSTWVDERGVHAPRTFFSVSRVWAEACGARVPSSLKAAEAELHDALRDSVQRHMVADVPVSCFLSAGIDSGSLLALMAEGGQAVHATTLGFQEYAGRSDDEVPLAASVAALYGARHNARRVDQAEFLGDLPAILRAMDQPSIDGINTWFVSKATAELGLKVAISGLGGDELLGGYPSFRDVPRFVRASRMPSLVPGLGSAVRAVTAPVIRRVRGAHPKMAGLIEYGSTYFGAYMLKRGLFMPWELTGILRADTIEAGLMRLAQLANAEEPQATMGYAKVATLEASKYMRNQLLRDTDWASMAHSLEVRVPLVDTALLKRAAALVLHTPGIGKRTLATAPRSPLPQNIRDRPKTGFSTPVERWLRSAEEFDAWRRYATALGSNCPPSRRLAVAIGEAFELQG